MPDDSWIDLKKDPITGIETLRAHFTGHAYDLHWHDSYLIGFTEMGVQQFNCRKQLCTSLAGGSFLLEPGEIHDGESPLETGFTYRQLYIPVDWLQQNLATLFHDLPDKFELNIDKTLMQDTLNRMVIFKEGFYPQTIIIKTIKPLAAPSLTRYSLGFSQCDVKTINWVKLR